MLLKNFTKILIIILAFILISISVIYFFLTPRFEIEPPRPQFWNYPPLSQAKYQTDITKEGKILIQLEHPHLDGVTPQMLSWWYRNLASGEAVIQDKKYSYYHLFHLSEHGQTRVVSPSTDGSFGMGIGSIIYRQERFGKYLSKGQGKVTSMGEHGFTVIPIWGLFELGSIEHQFIKTENGTLYKVKTILGSDAPFIGPILNLYIKKIQFHEKIVQEWIRHQVEEVGSLPHFLPKLYNDKNTPLNVKYNKLHP